MSVKATDVPQLAGVRAEVDDLPSDRDAIFNGERTIRYHDRTFPGLVFDGPVAERLSAAAGRGLLSAPGARCRVVRPGRIGVNDDCAGGGACGARTRDPGIMSPLL